MYIKRIHDDPLSYLKYPDVGYPKRIKWKVITPVGAKLSVLQESDIVFDKHDLKIRGLL